jgi:hypothetical protein
MKRLLTAAAASLLLTLALVAPVGAVGPGCSDFGHASAAGGHREMDPPFTGWIFGEVVRFVAHGGLVQYGLPDSVSGLVQLEHSTMCTNP